MWGGWDRYRTSQRWSPQWTRLNTKTTTFNKKHWSLTSTSSYWYTSDCILIHFLHTLFIYRDILLHFLYRPWKLWNFENASFEGNKHSTTFSLKALSLLATHEYFLIFTGAGNASVDHNFTNMSPLVNFIFVCVLECCSVTLLFIASCHPRFLLRFGWDYLLLKIIFNIF